MYAGVTCGSVLEVRALAGIPTIREGDDLAALIDAALQHAHVTLADQDILVVTSKALSRAEGCFVDLSTIEPSGKARRLAAEVDKDARLVELILRDSAAISRKRRGALIVRHRLGFVSANAGIDASNADPDDGRPGEGPWVLTLPNDPDRSAQRLADGILGRHGAQVAVVVTDSWGRPFRRGTVGFCIGLSGIPAIVDQRGQPDRFGRELIATLPAIADPLAALGDLVAGQAAEGTPLVHVRGLRFAKTSDAAKELLREPTEDLYA